MRRQVSEGWNTVAGVAVACGGAGLLAMALLQWHIAAHWVDLYAQHPMTGYMPEVVAQMPPDFLSSELSRAMAQALVGVVSLVATVAFPGRAPVVVLSVLTGAWAVTEGLMLVTPGAFSSNLGPLAVLVHFILSALFLASGAIAGALPGAGINWLRARFPA